MLLPRAEGQASLSLALGPVSCHRLGLERKERHKSSKVSKAQAEALAAPEVVTGTPASYFGYFGGYFSHSAPL